MKGGCESKPPANGVKTNLRLTDSLQNKYRKEIVMKRLFAFMMALVLILTLGVTAFADENTGSITITNATIGNTYNLFHIFNATYSTDEDGNTEAVSYSITTDNQFFSYMFGADGSLDDGCGWSHHICKP